MLTDDHASIHTSKDTFIQTNTCLLTMIQQIELHKPVPQFHVQCTFIIFIPPTCTGI